MYNRYIPQDDGSFRRCHIPDPPQPKPPAPPQMPPCPPPQTEPPCKDEASPCPPPQTPTCKQNGSAEGFLRSLLPKGLDTGDLMVIVLLLLMAGDNHSDQNFALLTLVIYLFL